MCGIANTNQTPPTSLPGTAWRADLGRLVSEKSTFASRMAAKKIDIHGAKPAVQEHSLGDLRIGLQVSNTSSYVPVQPGAPRRTDDGKNLPRPPKTLLTGRELLSPATDIKPDIQAAFGGAPRPKRDRQPRQKQSKPIEPPNPELIKAAFGGGGSPGSEAAVGDNTKPLQSKRNQQPKQKPIEPPNPELIRAAFGGSSPKQESAASDDRVFRSQEGQERQVSRRRAPSVQPPDPEFIRAAFGKDPVEHERSYRQQNLDEAGNSSTITTNSDSRSRLYANNFDDNVSRTDRSSLKPRSRPPKHATEAMLSSPSVLDESRRQEIMAAFRGGEDAPSRGSGSGQRNNSTRGGRAATSSRGGRSARGGRRDDGIEDVMEPGEEWIPRAPQDPSIPVPATNFTRLFDPSPISPVPSVPLHQLTMTLQPGDRKPSSGEIKTFALERFGGRYDAYMPSAQIRRDGKAIGPAGYADIVLSRNRTQSLKDRKVARDVIGSFMSKAATIVPPLKGDKSIEARL